MFRRTAIAGITALILITGQGNGQEPEQNGDSPATVEEKPVSDDPISVIVVPDAAEAEASKRREEEGAQIQKRDLAAQQRMADATVAMNRATWYIMWAAWVSAAIGAGGLTALVWTFIEQRKLFRDQERAVLEVEKGAFWPRMYHGSPHMHFDILLRNTGRTHARNVRIEGKTRWHPGDKLIDEAEFIVEPDGEIIIEPITGVCAEIPPNSHDVVVSHQETRIDTSKLIDAHKSWGSYGPNVMGLSPHLTFHGEVIYDDVFGEPQSRQFNFTCYTRSNHVPVYLGVGARHWRTAQYEREEHGTLAKMRQDRAEPSNQQE